MQHFLKHGLIALGKKGKDMGLNTSFTVAEAISSKKNKKNESTTVRGEAYFQEQVDLYGIVDHQSVYYQKINTLFTNLLQNERLSAYISNAQLEILFTNHPTAFKIKETNKICISLGMIEKYCRLEHEGEISEDMVAFILTHELVHQKYANKDTSSRDDIDEQVAAYILPREEEKIADKETMAILNECGYNPDAGLIFFEGLANENDETNDQDGKTEVLIDFFMEGFTHIFNDPHESTTRRIAYIKQYLEENTYKNKGATHKQLVIDKGTISFDHMSFLNLFAHSKIEQAKQKIENINQAFFFTASVTHQSRYNHTKIRADDHLTQLISSHIAKSYTHLLPVIQGMCTHTLEGHSDTFFVDLCTNKK